jgi:hypothetical protein
MLIAEAHAWTALLKLHGSVVSTSSMQAAEIAHETTYSDTNEATSQRVASYIAALTFVASQADALVSETIRLRSIRKAKHQVESLAIAELLRLHNDEVLALGESTSRNLAMSISSATAEIRATTQKLRSQVAQGRALLEVIQESRGLVLPLDTTIVMGVQNSAGQINTMPVEELLASCYAKGALTEETLVGVLREKTCGGSPLSSSDPAQERRVFSLRRTNDKASAR